MVRTRTALRPVLDLASFDADAAAFQADAAERQYAAAAGTDRPTSQAMLYAGRESLFSQATVESLRAAYEGSGEADPHLRARLAFAARGFLARATADDTDAVSAAEAFSTIGWRGERIPMRSAPARIATTSDRLERNALFELYLRSVEGINPIRIELLEHLHGASADLGFGSLVDLVRVTEGWNPDEIAASARLALNDTETGFYAAMRRMVARIGIEQGDGSLADAWYVLRGMGWDAWFGPRRLVPVAESTLRGLGLDLQAPGVRLDLEPSASKLPGATFVPVRVSEDVRLVANPQGGWREMWDLLRGMGRLQHLSGTDPNLPIDERLFGDSAVSDGYGLLFAGLVADTGWLSGVLEMPPDDALAFADFAAIAELMRLRTTAGRLIYELALHRGGDHAVHRAMYSGTMGLLAGVRWPEELYLTDVGLGLRPAVEIRATLVAGELAESLAARFADGWWRSTDAGAELRGLFARGLGWNAERVVAQLGYDALDWRPVLRKIRTQLIGEMSGYGGPNITTRAGTRKI